MFPPSTETLSSGMCTVVQEEAYKYARQVLGEILLGEIIALHKCKIGIHPFSNVT